MSPFPTKARTGVDFYRSPLHGALGFMPEYTEHARANPIEIVCGIRLLTDEEIEREAAYLRETRNELLRDELETHAVLTHRQDIHEKFEQVQAMKRRLQDMEAELSAAKDAE
jgi:polyhydroxyalkanoate synthesis regulator phasin|tara:strand:+ start:1622 stop:1957 length:336 start_codon:yes stop_codon:yes gene_type:complete